MTGNERGYPLHPRAISRMIDSCADSAFWEGGRGGGRLWAEDYISRSMVTIATENATASLASLGRFPVYGFL